MDERVQVDEARWRCDDGVEIPATIHAPARPRAAVVIAPAMAVPRQFYRRFAAYLAGRGLAAATFDYRGIGDAARSLPDPRAARMQDWGRLDLHAALAQAGARWAGLPLFLLGHSAGTQLAGLTPLAERLAGMVFVAAPRPHPFEGRGAALLFGLLWWYAVVPLATRGRWFPARRLRFAGVDIPSGVAAEWGRWARSPRYLFSPEHGIDVSRYARFTQPILAFQFSDDAYTPRVSSERLLSEYPNARVTRRDVRPADVGVPAIGHLGFFREALRETLWREAADWLLARAAPAEAVRRTA